MAKLLLNAGSTSLKYQLFSEDGQVLKKGGLGQVKNFQLAFDRVVDELKFTEKITAIGHRIVHGGDQYHQPVLIDDQVVDYLTSITKLAPLHLPFNLLGVHFARNHWPDLPQIALFDTAFFANLPAEAKTYALPDQLVEKYAWHKYGFHGLSHYYLTQVAAEQLGKKANQVNLVIAHLGGGSSVSAIRGGQAIDISMGWSPAAGLPMMTRCGNIDPGLVLTIVEDLPGPINQDKINQVRELINKQSGLRGLCGYDDFLDILEARRQGEVKAILAFNYYVYRLIQFIGAYWATLDGQVDAVVLSGAIGAGSKDLQTIIADRLAKWSVIPLLPIETNEEVAMFRQIKEMGW